MSQDASPSDLLIRWQEAREKGEPLSPQELCKECPAFAVESHALTLRNLCNHYGPVTRKEVELMPEADEMFKLVQDYVDSITVIA